MEEVGMPAHEVLQSATITNAKILEMQDKLGKIKSGYYADIVGSDENALENIATLEKISFVMKDGKVYKHKP